MRFQLNERVLTLYFEGELNSYNADNMEKEIEDVVSKQDFDTLYLDF